MKCDTCAVTINSDGSSTHAPGCLTVAHAELQKRHDHHLHILHKIGHLLKEVGIGVVETGVEIIGPGVSR